MQRVSGVLEGVQAQTMSVYHTAKAKGLKIVPVLNKVSKLDLSSLRSMYERWRVVGRFARRRRGASYCSTRFYIQHLAG